MADDARSSSPQGGSANKMLSAVAVAFALEARAAAIERMRAGDRVQPHSRALPSETEMAEARFAARELRTIADDLRAGVLE